jgi:UDP-4-amino-4,6-dideoxy-L-N-acetyl-beta-L-altrosamine transaminase
MNYDYAFYSFHPVKPVCMSNGGLLATNNRESAEYMFSGRNFGRKHIDDTYDLVQSGFNFYMNNLNAALGLSQLDRCLENVTKRKVNFQFLKQNIPKELGYFTDHDESSSYYLSSLVLNEGFSSGIMRKILRDNGVQSSFHYPFLHKTKFYKQDVDLGKLDSLEDKIINLPIHQELLPEEMEKIINECICYSRGGR